MDVHAALEEVARWCAEQTAAGDAEKVEVTCHAEVAITIGEDAPPWSVRRERRCSSGASSPIAQLRYDADDREWTLHHLEPPPHGWCSYDDARTARKIAPLLAEIARDGARRFQRIPPSLVDLLNRPRPTPRRR